MKKIYTLLAIAATAAALSLNMNAASPRKALNWTAWAAPAQMNVNEAEVPAEATPFFLMIELGPSGNARAQYCESFGEYGGAREIGPSFPLRYKIRKVHNDGSMDIKLKGEIFDGSTAIYKTRPRKKILNSAARVHNDTLKCGFGTFIKIE